MPNHFRIILILIICGLSIIENQAQKPRNLSITYFTDTTFSQTEPYYNYNFGLPVRSELFTEDQAGYEPTFNHRYFMSLYGPRHKFTSTSNIGYYDFHKGTDITPDVFFGTDTFDDTSPPNLYSMCTGVVHQIFDGPDSVMETFGTGRYITIKCNDTFRADSSWGPIYIAYRHPAYIDSTLSVGDTVYQDSFLAIMGASGHTSTVHLHMSVIRRNTGSEENVHPSRIFDPTTDTHMLAYLDHMEIQQLSYGEDTALFRMIFPYNKTNIRTIRVSLMGDTFSREYDFEAISMFSEDDRDDNDLVSGLEFFAYPLNRGQFAYRRLWDRYYDNQIPAFYAGNPSAGKGRFSPFLSEGLLTEPSYVLEMRVKDLPSGYNIEDLRIEVRDIWGRGARTTGVRDSGTFAWSFVWTEEDDAEEYQSGNVDDDSPDLDLVRDAGLSVTHEAVALRFLYVGLPKGKIYNSAYLQFRADADDNNAVTLEVYAEDTANSAALLEVDSNLRKRNLTDTFITWTPPSWTQDDMGAAQQVDILPLILELTNRADWDTSSPITIIIKGDGVGAREAEGFDADDLWRNAYVYIQYIDSALSDTTITLNLGLNEYTADFITIYPNPASKFAIVSMEESDVRIDNLKIIDIHGRLIESFNSNIFDDNLNAVIDVSQYSSGQYFVLLNTDKGRLVNKLVIR